MNSCPSGDVSVDNLICMTWIWHAFFSSKLPWNPDDAIVSKHDNYHLNVWSSQKSVEFVRIWNEFSLRPVFLEGNFPHIELRQSFAKPRFAALYLIDSLSSLIPLLSQNERIYRSSSSGFWTQLGYPLASPFSFKNVFIYCTKSPRSPVSGLYRVTWYSYTS